MLTCIRPPYLLQVCLFPLIASSQFFISHFLQLFMGNIISSELTSTNFFPGPVMARFVRFYPQSWHIFIALRVELYGCYTGKL